MNEKALDVQNIKDAQNKVSDIKVVGDGDTFALLCKASSQEQGWMKSTKVCNVDDGCIVQVTTQQKNPDGSYAVAEALTYVPRVHMDRECTPPQFKAIDYPKFSGQLGQVPAYTEADAEEQKRSNDEYKYRDYLGILLQLHQAGHECHDEINETLKKLQSLMF